MLTNRQVADSWMRESDLDEMLSAERYEHVLVKLESMLDAVQAEHRRQIAETRAARLTPAEVEVLRGLVALGEKATAAPWSAEYKYALLGKDGVLVAPDRGLHEDGDGIRWEDKEFIAAARNAVHIIAKIVGEGT